MKSIDLAEYKCICSSTGQSAWLRTKRLGIRLPPGVQTSKIELFNVYSIFDTKIKMAQWCNGSHARLKILFPVGSAGSSPA